MERIYFSEDAVSFDDTSEEQFAVNKSVHSKLVLLQLSRSVRDHSRTIALSDCTKQLSLSSISPLDTSSSELRVSGDGGEEDVSSDSCDAGEGGEAGGAGEASDGGDCLVSSWGGPTSVGGVFYDIRTKLLPREVCDRTVQG